MVASKIDIANKDKLAKLKRYCKKQKLELFPISAVTGKGIDDLKYAMAEKVEQVRLRDKATEYQVPSSESQPIEAKTKN
jgi:GTPase